MTVVWIWLNKNSLCLWRQIKFAMHSLERKTEKHDNAVFAANCESVLT